MWTDVRIVVVFDMCKPSSEIMSKLVKENLYFMNMIAKTPSKRQVQQLLDTITKGQLLSLTEVALNLLEGNIPLSKQHKKRLAKYKHFIRQLGAKDVSLKRKRLALCHRATAVSALLKACDKVLSTL